MRNIIAIYRRELGSYFASPIAYIVIGVFLSITGLLFYFGIFSRIITQVMQYRMQAQQQGQSGDIDIPSILIQQLMLAYTPAVDGTIIGVTCPQEEELHLGTRSNLSHLT